MFLLEDLFDVKDIDQDGKKFDNGHHTPNPPPLPRPLQRVRSISRSPMPKRRIWRQGKTAWLMDCPHTHWLCRCKRGYTLRISIVPSCLTARVEEDEEEVVVVVAVLVS
jgi:hypothetical protein